MTLSKSDTPKQTFMSVQNKLTRIIAQRLSLVALVCLVFATSYSLPGIAAAQSTQQRINELNRQNNQTKTVVGALEVTADSYEATIATLGAQISSLNAEITANQQRRDELARQITEKEAELVHQQDVIGKSIRAQYLEGDMSTVEMIVTSKNLSHYLDKQQYRQSVQNKIKTTLDTIQAIKASLADQKVLSEKLLAEQEVMKSQLAMQQSEQNRLLALNQSEQAVLGAQIQSTNSQIAELRRQQARENARLFRGRVQNVPDTTGYPWANVQPFPNSYPDPWGMYKRQCVSYTAWKVHKDGKRMPYWGGRGNAKNWANNARNDGIPVHNSPKPGDIAVSTRGTYGHVMYVEDVYNNGTMRISQYNAGWDGRYSEAIVNTAGLEYVRFQ